MNRRGSAKRWTGPASVALLVTLLVVATAAACGSSGGARAGSVDGAPAIIEATAPAGTELPDGFTVAPGSVLIGSVIPEDISVVLSGVPIVDRGWSAVFLVPGDPARVFEHFITQGIEAGVTPRPGSFRCPTPDRADTFVCQYYGYGGPNPAADSLTLELERHGARPGVPPASHLVMRFTSTGAKPARTAADPPAVNGEPPPPFPIDWPQLLQPGDRIPDEIAIMGTELVIEPGTRLIAPLAPFSGCATGGFIGGFEVTGDVGDIVNGYARQFEADQFDGEVATRTDDGATMTEALYYLPGGGDVQARAIERPGQRTYLELSRCND